MPKPEGKKSKTKLKRLFVLTIILPLVVTVFCARWVYGVDYSKPRFYIKLKGIGNITSAGIFGEMADANSERFTRLGEASTNYSITADVPSFFRGFGGEIGFETKKFAVGIAAEYFEKTFHLDFDYLDNNGSGFHYLRDQKLSAIPLFLFIHFKVIDTSFLNVFLSLGEGVYLAKYRDDVTQTYTNHPSLTHATSYLNSTFNHLGFTIGTTIDLKISKNLAFFVDAGYRLAKFDDIKGKDFVETNKGITENEGPLYYWTNSINNERRFVIGEVTDNYVAWTGIPAELNMNGFSFSAGFKVTFGGGKKDTVKIAPLR